ncbi:MAG TPA: hypothetical protein PKY77_15800 [Phycisphaerae bacterium]|nr:hypothetical protein [Phycisphaerae bacterium]HRY70720.1 hypothetical protein [Phycisphaerae bacterium]HSA28754.1 hypothetical protein [Phycisphaerae bacterium]
MKLPEVPSPERYSGLYVFDFGDQAAIGYTADEIAVLLESEKYRHGKVYRIHRALPDGTMELAGVPHERFQLEDGILFYRSTSEAARADYEALNRLAADAPPPCRMKVQLARLQGAAHSELTAIIFPAEFTHEVAGWLNRLGYSGGDFVEGGPSQVTNYYEAGPVIISRQQLWPAADDSRPAEEVLATTHLAVQRIPA